MKADAAPLLALFEFNDEFVAFLTENGVSKGGANYVTWMNRAARRLGRTIGPNELSSEADVEVLMNRDILFHTTPPHPRQRQRHGPDAGTSHWRPRLRHRRLPARRPRLHLPTED
jgi:hypothetical protein